jgi:hypothetical protein
MTENEFWAVMKQTLTILTDTAMRGLYTEITALSVVVEAFKKARPEQAQIIDHMIQMARDSEDTKRSVDQRIEPILKIVRLLDGPDRDRAIQDLTKQYGGIGRPN